MKRPFVIGKAEHLAPLRARFAPDCALAPVSGRDEILGRLERARDAGEDVLLVVLGAGTERIAEAIAEVSVVAPGAAIAVAGELEGASLRPTFTIAPSGRGLEELTALLLERRRLELVASTGVAMASSFDIRAILERARDASAEVLDGVRAEVFYAGCPAINARPCWYPEADDGHLSPGERERIAERLAAGAEPDSALASTVVIAHQGELFGAIVHEGTFELAEDRRKLLSMVALQAGTALANIHSAQERIQFERLSAIGRMIGSIVHDFRSPLTALRGYAGMLAKLDLDRSERREFASALLEECDRLGRMVEELLHFTRGRGPKLELEWTRLGPYLRGLERRASQHFRGDGIEVEAEIGFDGELLLDRARFERALWNAVTNGSQAMGVEGGKLRLRSRRLEGDRAAIEIEDEGEGIPEEIRHRIFEPFFSYGKSEGIGLGMATAKRIAEEHEGRIEVESRRGRGTLVRFVLPLHPRTEEMALPAAGRSKLKKT